MICALLVFQTPELPSPLAQLSPWVDWLVVPHEEVLARDSHKGTESTPSSALTRPYPARAGDCVIVWRLDRLDRLDRLSRSMRHLLTP